MNRRVGLYNSASSFTVTLKKHSYGYQYIAGYGYVAYSINGGNYVTISNLDSDIVLTDVLTIQFRAIAQTGEIASMVGTSATGTDIALANGSTKTSSLITLTSSKTYYCGVSAGGPM